MVEWAGKTMEERTILFHRRFPSKIISKSALHRLYIKNGARRKQIKVDKSMPTRKSGHYENQRLKILK